MRWRRNLAALVLAGVLLPLSWWRAELAPAGPPSLRYQALAAIDEPGWPENLRLAGAWRLNSHDPAFGGFSTLALLGDGKLLAFSDFGQEAQFSRPRAGLLRPRLAAVPRDPAIRFIPDVESAVFDPEQQVLWLGYENHNAIRRLGPQGVSRVIRPPAMRGWGQNSGAEAMARLADGRFIVLSEAGGEGLLFPGDPVAGQAPLRFRFAAPGDYRPTDMAVLPDGRVLVLLRALRWHLPPFASMLALADPAQIRAGRRWGMQPLATISSAPLRENYEGIAVAPRRDGAIDIWLISDDNRSALQSTMLLRLEWRPEG